jgi:hypothetical protein
LKHVKIISLFVFLILPCFTFGQQQDFTGLTGITLSKNINRAWDVSLGAQTMFNQNLHELWFAFTDGSVGFRINRNLNTELHARIIQFRQLDNSYRQRQLFYHTLTWSKGFGRWGISLRNRLQQLVYGEHFNDGFKGPVWYNRNRIALRYRINYYWSPYISAEGIVPLNHIRRRGIDQYRIATGISYTHNDFVRLDVFYQVQQQLQRSSGNNTYFVLGLTASIKIP